MDKCKCDKNGITLCDEREITIKQGGGRDKLIEKIKNDPNYRCAYCGEDLVYNKFDHGGITEVNPLLDLFGGLNNICKPSVNLTMKAGFETIRDLKKDRDMLFLVIDTDNAGERALIKRHMLNDYNTPEDLKEKAFIDRGNNLNICLSCDLEKVKKYYAVTEIKKAEKEEI